MHSSAFSTVDLDELTTLFRLLADRTRLHILLILTGGERNVSSLCDELALPQPTVSHHLGLLRTGKVIGHRRSGKQVFYALSRNLQADQGLSVELDKYTIQMSPRSQSTVAAIKRSDG